MAFIKYLAPVLSVAAAASGESSKHELGVFNSDTDIFKAANCGSSSSTLTIQSGGDATALGSCKTVTGSVAIATGAASGGSLDLGTVGSITGSLEYAGDTAVQSFSANSLSSLGSLNLTGLSALSSLKLTSLQEVGSLTLQNLPALQSFDFGTGFSKAGVITIINTDVNDISSASQADQVTGIVISDNQFLSNVSFEIEALGLADIGPNNLQNGLSLDFPNLATAESLTFRNATEISTPSLTNVTNTLGLYGNKISSYAAPKLSWCGALVVNDNPQLTNLSFPALKFINSTQNATLQVANNTKLSTIDGFQQLSSVSGNVDFSGNIDT